MASKALLFFLVLFFESKYANSECFTDSLYKFWGTKTDYDEVRGRNNENDFKINGCTPFSMWFLTRHGSRYPDNSEITYLLEALPKLKEEILNKKELQICDKEKQFLNNWFPTMTIYDDHNITVVGTQEMTELADRFRHRFSSILNNQNSMFSARAAIGRTKKTIGDFMDTFFKDDISRLPTVESYKNDQLLDYISSCKKFSKFESNKTYCAFEKDFVSTSRYKDDVKIFMKKINMSKFLNYSSKDTLEIAYKTCIYEYLINNRTQESTTWCAPFSKEIFQMLQFKEDLDKHCQYGYKYKISAEMTCELRTHLLNYMRNITLSPNPHSINNLFFTQGSGLLPFLTALGLYRSHIGDENYVENKDRTWRSSILDPMNANILFVFYKCSNSFSMKVFHNEKPVKLPNGVCDSNYVCNISKFINDLAITTDNCNFTALCKGTVTDDDLLPPFELTDTTTNMITTNSIETSVSTTNNPLNNSTKINTLKTKDLIDHSHASLNNKMAPLMLFFCSYIFIYLIYAVY